MLQLSFVTIRRSHVTAREYKVIEKKRLRLSASMRSQVLYRAAQVYKVKQQRFGKPTKVQKASLQLRL